MIVLVELDQYFVLNKKKCQTQIQYDDLKAQAMSGSLTTENESNM